MLRQGLFHMRGALFRTAASTAPILSSASAPLSSSATSRLPAPSVSQEEPLRSSRYRYVMGLLLGAVAAGGLLNERKAFATEVATPEAPSWTDKIKGNYQNRIRQFSTPEKQFEVFASIKGDSGESFMTLADFRDSILPYDFASASADQTSVQDVPDIFQAIDIDGDGLISFDEYMFYTSFLSIPAHQYELAFKMFDNNGDGTLDLEEFQVVMNAITRSSVFGSQRRNANATGLPDPRTGMRKRVDDGSAPAASGLLSIFFGADGQKALSFEEFKQFMEQFYLAVLQLEFQRFDRTGQGYISARDFGMAIVGYAKPQRAEEYAGRVELLRSDTRTVSWDDFVKYQLAMQQSPEICTALELYSLTGNPFSRRDIKRAIRAVTGVVLTDVQLDVLFFLFDQDSSGGFDLEEMAIIFHSRNTRNLSQQRVTGFTNLLRCCKECFTG